MSVNSDFQSSLHEIEPSKKSLSLDIQERYSAIESFIGITDGNRSFLGNWFNDPMINKLLSSIYYALVELISLEQTFGENSERYKNLVDQIDQLKQDLKELFDGMFENAGSSSSIRFNRRAAVIRRLFGFKES